MGVRGAALITAIVAALLGAVFTAYGLTTSPLDGEIRVYEIKLSFIDDETALVEFDDGRVEVVKVVRVGREVIRGKVRLLDNKTLLVELENGEVLTGEVTWIGSPQPAKIEQIEETEDTKKPIKVEIPISGTIRPREMHTFGPYSGVYSTTFDVGWQPPSLGLCVGYIYGDTLSGQTACLIGGRIRASFAVDYSRSIYAFVFNPSVAAISYGGVLTLYYD